MSRSSVLGGAVVRAALAAAVGVTTSLVASEARADMSSWFSVQGGYAKLQWTEPPMYERKRYTMPIDVGLGAPPSWPILLGVGARMTPYFGQGTDWALYGRLTHRGYLTGHVGLALDGGVYTRAFGVGSSGYMGTATLGLPWGIIASATYEKGNSEAKTLSFGLGVDFLRLTVYRTANEQQWPNVRPAHRE